MTLLFQLGEVFRAADPSLIVMSEEEDEESAPVLPERLSTKDEKEGTASILFFLCEADGRPSTAPRK